ncbi:hypothetical protein [Psychrobacillus sp. FJAT-21963]|uniref:hypothetical protein n=1 Tax=Psychrobacillus sp. FJAT-21963 TaxID=1712028 RepID=UPI000701F54E|nr:hypothetical protein [Psychrobacillus sp. FJAT-21963]KQL33664.1 hypothetical protein AN959_16170 [Psychrobacillus sp. FJAT-21963]
MKIIGISILMFVFLTVFSLCMDILLGFDLNTSINNAIRPFLVMEVTEIVIFFLLIVLMVVGPVRTSYNKRKKKQQR